MADTHPLIWFLSRNPNLSKAAEAVFRDDEASLVVPTIVLAEITHLRAKRRISVERVDAKTYLAALRNAIIRPLDENVIERLPTLLDIHDAIIVATALLYRDSFGEPTAVVTKDSQIRNSGLIEIVW